VQDPDSATAREWPALFNGHVENIVSGNHETVELMAVRLQIDTELIVPRRLDLESVGIEAFGVRHVVRDDCLQPLHAIFLGLGTQGIGRCKTQRDQE